MLRMGGCEEEEEAQGDSSECSSGCQSGWTMYLDHSFDNQHHLPFLKPSSTPHDHPLQEKPEDEEEEEEEEEDLSMVSDASSGPPHHHEEEEECHHHCFFFSDGKRRRVEGEKQQQESQKQELSSFLDDTASSPLLTFPKKTSFNGSMSLEFSSCFSATHFNGKTSPFLHSENTSGCGKEEGGKNKW